MKKTIPIRVDAYQDFVVHEKNDGSLVPYLSQSIFIDHMAEPFFENEIPLSEVLDSLIEGHILISGTIKDQDKDHLISHLDAILQLVQKKKEKAQSLIGLTEPQKTTSKRIGKK